MAPTTDPTRPIASSSKIRSASRPPTKDPASPSRMVPIQPMGSRPGTSSRASAPATNPNSTQPMMPTARSFSRAPAGLMPTQRGPETFRSVRGADEVFAAGSPERRLVPGVERLGQREHLEHLGHGALRLHLAPGHGHHQVQLPEPEFVGVVGLHVHPDGGSALGNVVTVEHLTLGEVDEDRAVRI